MSDNFNDFTLRRLGVLAYANGFTQWVYVAPNTPLAQIERAGFFNSASDMINTGDHIHVTATDAATILWVVSSSEAGGVIARRMVFA